jgi:hypothetical protein
MASLTALLNLPIPPEIIGIIKQILPKLLELLSALPPQLIIAAIKDLLKFIEAVKPEDLVLLVSAIADMYANSQLPVPVPTDDRLLVRDHILRIASTAPQDNFVTTLLKSTLIKQLWDSLPKPFDVKPPAGTPDIPINLKFRLADGRGNAAGYPAVGMGWTKYNVLKKSERALGPLDNRPPASDIFAKLFERKKFIPHPNNINTFFFHFATLITHDLFWTKEGDLSVNTASSYLDLQPLYGRTEDEVKIIRTGQLGLIRPDYFASIRVAFSLPGVGVLLVLFSRNHNFIAKTLLERNENGRFDSTKYSPKELDEELFQTARIINGGCYYNLIFTDYIRTILGVPYNSEFFLDPVMDPPAFGEHHGNHNSIEFSYVYRWHNAIGEIDAGLVRGLLEAAHPDGIKLPIEKGLPIYNHKGKPMIRKEHGFDDAELAYEINRSMGHVAGHPGAFNIPQIFKNIEVYGINQGRQENIHVPSLNEYRAFLKLKTYTKFEDINDNKDVTAALRDLYRHVDDVELYPGLIAEQTKLQGTAFPFTGTTGLLVDAVNVFRNDRFITTDFTPERVTEWGYKLAKNPKEAGRPAFNTSILSHLLSLLNGQFSMEDPRIRNPYFIS